MSTITDILININNIQNRKSNIDGLFKMTSKGIKKNVNIITHPGPLGQSEKFVILKNNLIEQLNDIINVVDHDYCPKIRLFSYDGIQTEVLNGNIPFIEQSIFICFSKTVPYVVSTDLFRFPLNNTEYPKFINHINKNDTSASYNYDRMYEVDDNIEPVIINWINSLPSKNEKIKVKLIKQHQEFGIYSPLENIRIQIEKEFEDFIDIGNCNDCPIIRIISRENFNIIDDLGIDKHEQSIFIVSGSIDNSKVSKSYGFPNNQNEFDGNNGKRYYLYKKVYGTMITKNDKLSPQSISEIKSWLNNVKAIQQQKIDL